MTDIPKARGILEAMLSWELEDHVRDDIGAALQLMTRVVRSPRRTTNQRMTPEIGDQARALHRATNLSNAEIGRRLRVDGGRVSEAINGQWTA